MSRFRKRAGYGSRRRFTKTAKRVHPRNGGSYAMRGGIRL